MKISVLIPCYNAAEYLPATLATVWKQRYDDLEVIVADGGSTDTTVDVLRAYEPMVTRWVSEPDEGQLDALMKAASMATGDVCYWLNADDAAMPGAFAHVAELFRGEPDTEIVFSDDYAFDESARRLYVGETIRGMTFEDHFYYYRQMYSECVFWRRELTPDAEPIDRELRLYTDYSFFLPLRHGRKCRWTSKRLGAFRIVPGQASRTFRESRAHEQDLIKSRMRERLGMSEDDYLAAKSRHAWSFRLRQRFVPRAVAAGRYLWRRATGDADRRRVADHLFDEWLKPPAEVADRLARTAEPTA